MNPFQAKYPLSPKKFWKKMIPTIVGYTVVFFIIAIVAILITFGDDTLSGWVGMPTVIGGVIALYVIILLLWAWYFKAYIRTYFYEGGDHFVTIRKKVFTPSEIHVQYQKIQDVYVDQDLLDRIMGLYDVHIASATVASGIEAHIDGVTKETAEGLKNFFFRQIQNPSNQAPQPVAESVASAASTTDSPVTLTQRISSENYPIQPAWFIRSAIGKAVLSIFYTAILGFWLIGVVENLTFWIGALAAVGIFVLISIIQIIGLLLWKGNYRFIFLPEYIQFHTGILSQSEQHLPYKSIQDVTISRSLLDRIFGLANVKIENAAQSFVGSGNTRRASNNGVNIIGLTPAQATEITEAMKGIILTKNSSQMGV